MSNQYIETGNNQRPSLTMWQYYRRAWTFPREKRASRTEANKVMQGILCSSAILSFLASVVVVFCCTGSLDADSLLILFIIFSLLLAWLQFFIIPGMPLFIRRVHDTGKSAWWPFILSYFFCFAFYFIDMVEKGDEGTNKYGPPPSL